MEFSPGVLDWSCVKRVLTGRELEDGGFPIGKFRDNALVLASKLGTMVASEARAVARRCR